MVRSNVAVAVVYNILEKQFLSKECGFRERDSYKLQSGKRFMHKTFFRFCIRVCLSCLDKSLQIFDDISKTLPPFRMKFSQVSFIHTYMGLKQMNDSQNQRDTLPLLCDGALARVTSRPRALEVFKMC